MGQIKRRKHGPEWYIQRELVAYLDARGWLVERMIGNAYQMGIPDLYAAHPRHGTRWIDVKNPHQYSFTIAQRRKWPRWERAGIGIWILTAANQTEYDRLFAPPNWRNYWKPNFELPDLEKEIDAIAGEA